MYKADKPKKKNLILHLITQVKISHHLARKK
jgi:hypothetical protein